MVWNELYCMYKSLLTTTIQCMYVCMCVCMYDVFMFDT